MNKDGLNPYDPEGTAISVALDKAQRVWHDYTVKAVKLDEITTRWSVLDAGIAFMVVNGPTPEDETDIVYPVAILVEMYSER